MQGLLRHSKIQTTLDLYTQEDSDETRAAQGAFLNAMEMRSSAVQQGVGWVVGCHLWLPSFLRFFGMNGGDDETRTRDLCRDRAAL